jgi:AraC-like DNA-binding protein
MATSLASAARPFWRLLVHCRIDPDYVFREAGLDPALMDQPRARYPVERRTAAWVKAVELSDDPCFGLKMAEVVRATDLHALGYAVLASSTLRTAIGRVARFVPVINDGITFSLDPAGDQLVFALKTDAYPSLLLAQEDSFWSWIVGFCRLAAGPHLDPVEVRLLHPEVPCKGEYFGFFRCPMRFNSEHSAILFSQADLDRPLPAANRELARANDQILTEFLAGLHNDDLIAKLKVAIAEELPSGSPTEERIAKAVYLSPRTLHRRLSAEDTTYSKLLDAVRRELAERYITDPDISLQEISSLLGFSELSAFSRAFRRWTGQPPSAARDAAA